MDRAVIQTAIEDFDLTMKHIGGCGDGYCCITGKATGMHTNGGCRCPRDNHAARRAMMAARRLRDTLEQFNK